MSSSVAPASLTGATRAAGAKHAARKAPGPRHEDKRVLILQTAAQLFATHGYEATSLDRIADQLGLHKASLYHYIKSKEEVLYQCLVRSFEDLDQVMEAMKDTRVPVLERLRHFALSLAQAQNNDFGRCLVLVGSRPLALASGNGIRDFQRQLDNTVRDLVREGMTRGDIKPSHPGLVSAMLFGTLNWVPQWYQPEGSLTIDEVVDAFIDMLTEGISAESR